MNACVSRIAGTTFILAALASCTLLNGPSVATPDVLLAVDCYPAAWNRHDAESLGRCFTTDADFVNSTGLWWQGRDAIQRNHAFLMGASDMAIRGIELPVRDYGVLKNSVLTFTSTHLRELSSDVKIARVAWRLANDARVAQARIGMMTLVLRNERGTWRIAAVHSAETDRPRR